MSYKQSLQTLLAQEPFDLTGTEKFQRASGIGGCDQRVVPYDRLAFPQNDRVKYYNEGGFYLISFAGPMDFSQWLGWKIHVSVPLVTAREAYDVIASIVAENHLAMRVLNLDDIDTPCHEEGKTRFTIYLTYNGENVLSSEVAKTMVKEIHKQLELRRFTERTALWQKTHPDAMLNPKADMRTFSQFCSLRNDDGEVGGLDTLITGMFCEEEFRGTERLTSDLVGECFNPLWRENPYENLLRERPEFDLARMFTELYEGDMSYQKIIIHSILAYLNKYIGMEKLSDRHVVNQLMHKDFSDVDKDVMKGDAMTPEIHQDLRLCLWMLGFLINRDDILIPQISCSNAAGEPGLSEDFKAFLGQIRINNPYVNVSKYHNFFDAWIEEQQAHRISATASSCNGDSVKRETGLIM